MIKMLYKKRNLLLSIIIIIIIQTLLYINNSQKNSFRYFIWNVQEIKIGKLISISFVSGYLISTLLNKVINKPDINNYRKDYDEKDEVNYEPLNEWEKESKFDIPPQRDIRDTQPTISVNYRVIKNNGENNKINEDNYSKQSKYQDDWIKDNTDW